MILLASSIIISGILILYTIYLFVFRKQTKVVGFVESIELIDFKEAGNFGLIKMYFPKLKYKYIFKNQTYEAEIGENNKFFYGFHDGKAGQFWRGIKQGSELNVLLSSRKPEISEPICPKRNSYRSKESMSLIGLFILLSLSTFLLMQYKNINNIWWAF